MNFPGGAVFFAYAALFAALYAGFGVQSPYLPALLREHGLDAELIGTVLAAGTAVRLAAGPAAARVADRFDAARLVFAVCAAGAAVAALGYVPAHGVWPLLAVNLLQAAALAPLAQLADALVLRTAAPGSRRFPYGWVRGVGSGAFILGTALSGEAVARRGLDTVIWLNAGLLLLAAAYIGRMRPLSPNPPPAASATPSRGDVMALLRSPEFRRILAVAALILGSHALHDSFAVIRWSDAGIGPATAGFLWSEAVAAEVVVFLVVGRPVLDRLGPAGVAVLASGAGALRWGISAETAWLPAVAAIQPLHGITFALLHLACMRRLAETVPPHLAATALALYGIVAIGAATALLTLLSGWLYGTIGARGFWAMAALCLIAVPVARKL
ncbi:MAG TPA: MFS transporter [Stellaceae bacterium]|nr:MFS transporter [Stellaceae bacterium]